MFARLIACLLVVAAVQICAAAVSPQGGGASAYRLTYPLKDWSLDFELRDIEVVREDFDREGRRVLLVAFLKKDGKPSKAAMLFMYLEPEQGVAGNAGLSEWALKRLRKSKTTRADTVKASEHKGVPVFKYTADFIPGAYVPPATFVGGVSARLLDAYMWRDGVLVTIRLMGQSLGGDEERALLSLLDSARFTDTSAPSTSFDHYHAGKARLLAKDYAGAARSLEVALDLELKGRQLGAEQFRGLIEGALEVLAARGDPEGAKWVLEFAASSEPESPTFHLWLARAHAAAGDLDKTIASLENAFRHRKNLPRLHPPLDPLSDRAFARFKDEEKFRRAVKAMKK